MNIHTDLLNAIDNEYKRLSVLDSLKFKIKDTREINFEMNLEMIQTKIKSFIIQNITKQDLLSCQKRQ